MFVFFVEQNLSCLFKIVLNIGVAISDLLSNNVSPKERYFLIFNDSNLECVTCSRLGNSKEISD